MPIRRKAFLIFNFIDRTLLISHGGPLSTILIRRRMMSLLGLATAYSEKGCICVCCGMGIWFYGLAFYYFK